MTQRISAEGYTALCDALATATWYRKPFKQLVSLHLAEYPELLTQLNFDRRKRETAEELIALLKRDERQYQDLTLALMVELSSRTHFPDIENLGEPERSNRLADARAAIARLKDLVNTHQGLLKDKEEFQKHIQHERSSAKEYQLHLEALAALRNRFLELQQRPMEPQSRGRAFESFLHDLFKLFNLAPQPGYKLDSEQIDGSFRFDTDDYILEAKWTKDPSTRADADTFAAKVQTKGKSALGLFVSVNGFTKDFRERFRERTPFLTMDGSDLFLILEGRIRLNDALLAKKRWANETGSCYYPVTEIIKT